MNQEKILNLHDKLKYGERKEIYKSIAKECNREWTSVRNWFISWKKTPYKFEEIVIKHLENGKFKYKKTQN